MSENEQLLRGVDGARRAGWAKFYEQRERIMRSLALEFVARKLQESDPVRADVLRGLCKWTLADGDWSNPRDTDVFEAQRDAAATAPLEDLARRAGVPPHVLTRWLEKARGVERRKDLARAWNEGYGAALGDERSENPYEETP